MEDQELRSLLDNYHRKIGKISLDFKRYLYSEINWDARMIGIKGARGVGKTTLLLQHILENYEDIDQTLYASLDDLWFATHSLIDLVDWAYRHGIDRLYLDEVHRYKLWSETLKNIYDNYPDMRIVYTSSSLLALDKAQILSLLTEKAKSYKSYKYLYKPEKIFLNNANLMHALCPRVDVGNMRETFFQNQLSVKHEVNAPRKGDFLVNGRYLFEVGGKNKTFDQIKDVPDSFLAVDETEVGYGNRIPLWMFGLLY